MLASLRVKSARGKRSGDGREGRCRLEKSASMPPGRPRGEGMQAKAWRTTSFEKVEGSKRDLNACSSSTSPETDPGASSVFPFFTEYRSAAADRLRGAGKGSRVQETIESGSTGRQRRRWRLRRGGDRSRFRPSRRRTAAAKASHGEWGRRAFLDYRNPMFHAPNGTAEKAVASLFSGQESEESTRSAMNGSNPMFKRSVTDSGRPRQSLSAMCLARLEVLTCLRSGSSILKYSIAAHIDGVPGNDTSNVSMFVGKKKKAKAMYEHVGRMNVRPFLEDHEGDFGLGHRGFRVDTFARNEGEAGGKAHFKFVFTLDNGDAGCGSGEDAKKLRPVLDVIHERSTGKLRVRVNDGREITAKESSAVDIALTHVGVVLFNPKTMAKGHHLYTLSLNGRTLFSVLA
ncbi:unnamed protein product [Scytosiphon promiscuus]